MNILGTICARGGSKGVKNKNIRMLCGKPLIAYSIEQLLKWNKAETVIVSTDSIEIAEIAKSYGAQVPFVRPSELATDDAGKIPVIRHAVRTAESIYDKIYDVIVDLDPTAPIRSISDLESCLNLFIDKKPLSIFSVVPAHKSPYFNMVELNGDGYAYISKKMSQTPLRRQDAAPVYEMNASIYLYSRNYILNDKTSSAISERSLIHVMSEIAGADIDRELDFKFVEFLMKEGFWKNE